VTTADAQTRLPLGRSLAAGLGAGGIAAIVAALVSLGLKSPDRVFLNSASVSIVVLLGGLITGFAYFSGAGRAQAVRNVAIWIVAAFLIVVAAVLAVEEHYRHPVDVEWVLDRSGGPPWVVQARPVTGLPDGEPVTGWDPVRYAFGDTA